MSNSSPPPGKWRWNDMPYYATDTLDRELLEQRLRTKFGNYKFFVERIPQLFIREGRGSVEFFRYEEQGNKFKSNVATDSQQLRGYLPCTTGQTKEEKHCSFIFVGAESSRDVLKISHEMLLWILSFFQVLPPFLEFIFPFGKRLYDIDFQFSGFRQDNRLSATLQRDAIPELGRSGQNYQICYNLKSVEPKEGQAPWPWSCRQTAVFHVFDTKTGHASWIIIKANNVVKERLKEVSEGRLKDDQTIFKDVRKMFANSLECHMAIVEWSAANWRWYINHFEEQYQELKRRTIVDKITPRAAREIASSMAVPVVQSVTPAPRRTWTLRSALSRIDTPNAPAPVPIPLQPVQPLPLSVSVPEDPPELPPDLPPGYDGSQDKPTDNKGQEYEIDELQRAQNVESNASEAILVLKSNIHILSQLRNYYDQLPNSPDLEPGFSDSFRTSVSSFLERIQMIRSDLQIHLDRLETIAKLVAECRNLLYGMVEYQSTQANKMFAQEAQRSAERMETMTRKMQELTLKTTLETVLMRIITVGADLFTDPEIQTFIAWVNDNSCPGATFRPGSLDTPTFVPDITIEEYFSVKRGRDLAKIKCLVKAATQQSSVPANARSIAQSCPKVFTILILIGQSRFIHSFVGNARLHDEHLPFHADEARLFPKFEGDATFFDDFNKQQWRFCVGQLRQSLDPLQIDNPIILPITRVGNLSKGSGASAVVRKVTLHEDYDGLAEPIDDEETDEQIISGDPHVYVVKSYHRPDAETYFKAEVDAFRKLNEAARPAPNVVGFYGAFMQNGSFNIILQYANIGTLEDYFAAARPPKLGEDILNLWRNLFKLNDALIDIHGLAHTSDAGQPRIFQGWHQDIKPANILVAGNLEDDPYNVLFMLADLGLSHFAAVVEEKTSLTGSPEFNLRAKLVNNFDKQKNDTWSLACVYSEVNTWIFEGNEGLQTYRAECQKEIDRQGGESKGGCFHNHRGSVLATVETWHIHRLPSMAANQDRITSIIWNEFLRHIFKLSEHRLTAPQVQNYATSVVQQARTLLQRSSGRQQETGQLNGNHFSSSGTRPQTPPEVPPEYQFSSSLLITPPYENPPKRSRTLEPHHLRQPTQSPDSPLSNGSPPTNFENRHPASPISNQHTLRLKNDTDSESLPRPFSSDFGTIRTRGQQAFMEDEYTEPTRLTASSRVRTQPNITNGSNGLPAEWKTTFSKGLSIHDEGARHNQLPAVTVNQEPSVIVPPLPELSGESKSKGKARMTDETQTLSHSSPIDTPRRDLSVERLDTWARMTRQSSSSFFGQTEHFLPHEKEVIGELKKRDHIFVIDDGKSMKQHWPQLQSLYANLIYLVKKKKLDPNGSELQFIMSDEHKEAKDTSDLVQIVARVGRQLRGESNFAARLDDIWDSYKKRLDNKRKPARPISLYVLTDGLWQPGNWQRNMVARVIQRMVEHLEAIRAKEKMIGIQFIRFGDHEVGKERLRWLDAELKPALGLARDICDTTSADGNVWKMLLGSINPYWDDDPDD
ncbi:MAG: hypothetical protein Q9160_005230 [Pyrenula sp. 1 TL-2023]